MWLLGYGLHPRIDNTAVPLPEPIWVQNFGCGEPWTPGRVQGTKGARMVIANSTEGDIMH